MISAARPTDRPVSRTKMGLGILAGVLATLAAAQVSASQPGAWPIATQGEAP